MKILKFKTNIFDNSQIDEIAPFLNAEKTISKWKIHNDDSQNILSVSGVKLDPSTLIRIIEECGYEAEILHILAIGGQDL